MSTRPPHHTSIPGHLPPNAVVLQVTCDFMHLLGGQRIPTGKLHQPYFLAVPDRQSGTELRDCLLDRKAHLDGAWHRVHSIGAPARLASFSNPGRSFEGVPVYVQHPGDIEAVAAAAFREADCWVVEHAVPYAQRVQADLAGEAWILDTRDSVVGLQLLALDVDAGDVEEPIRWAAWSRLPHALHSRTDLEGEAFEFDLHALPGHASEVVVREASTPQEEASLLWELVRAVQAADVVCAHGAYARVVPRLLHRLRFLCRNESLGVASQIVDELQAFVGVGFRCWTAFVDGQRREVASLLPATLDSEWAMEWLELEESELDPVGAEDGSGRGMVQARRTARLAPQVLQLAFLANLSLEDLVTSGHTKLWDHMAFLRCVKDGSSFPAPVRPGRILSLLWQQGGPWDRVALGRLVRKALVDGRAVEPEILRVATQGPQAPSWIEYGDALVDAEGQRCWRLPGGFMQRPQDLDAHGVPWHGVVEADAEAMYPTLVGALNASPDVVRLARRGEEPDAWAWWPGGGEGLSEARFALRAADERFGKGRMVGLRVSSRAGAMARAMQGVLRFSKRLKHAASEDPLARSLYEAVKRLRSAGTHGITGAWNVQSCQFHPPTSTWITTEGQRVMHQLVDSVRGDGHRLACVNTDGAWVLPPQSPMGDAADAGVGLEATLDHATLQVRTRLKVPEFALNVQRHDVVVWLGHNERLTLRRVADGVEADVQGSVLTGRDKPVLVRALMRRVLTEATLRVPRGLDAAKARQAFRSALAAAKVPLSLVDGDVDLAELVLVQKVRPPASYKPNPDARDIHKRRAQAIEAITGRKLTGETSVSFVVCKQALPGLEAFAKTPRMPTAYLWPVDHVRVEDVDLAWYAAYAEGALRDLLGST